MAELLLVNPRKRKKRRKMSALQRKYFGKRKGSSGVKRRRRRRTTSVFAARRTNPRRRRSHGVSHYRSRRRRNPSLRGLNLKGITGSIVPTIKAGLLGAAGALGNDLLFGYTKSYLPASVQTGVQRHAVKALYAVLVGVLGNVVMRGKGRDLANGAMTVVLHDALKEQLMTAVPSLPLGDYFSFAPAIGYDYEPALPLSTGIGQYMTGGNSGMGEYIDPTMNYSAY